MGIAAPNPTRFYWRLTPLRPLPSSGISGTEDRFEAGHVSDGVFDRNRNFAVSPHHPRENISLNGALIADRESFRAHAAAENIAPVIYKYSARPVVWRVEWYFDLDAPRGAQELHALVRRCAHSAIGQNGWRRLPNLECAVAPNSTISSSMP
jgi:hypothetical protein